ncbi:hypothetical protein ABPG73_000973 [Tetrahymena malaccensis]
MAYCGQGLIAQDVNSCSNSQNCIDGFTYKNQGVCYQSSSDQSQFENINQNKKNDVNSLIVYLMISLVGLLIIIILVIFLVGFKKYKQYIQNNKENSLKIQQIYQNQSTIETLRNEIQAQKLEITSLNQKVINLQLAQANPNCLIYETAQGQDKEDEESNDKQTINQIDIDIQQQYNSQQNFKQSPILKSQKSQ